MTLGAEPADVFSDAPLSLVPLHGAALRLQSDPQSKMGKGIGHSKNQTLGQSNGQGLIKKGFELPGMVQSSTVRQTMMAYGGYGGIHKDQFTGRPERAAQKVRITNTAGAADRSERTAPPGKN